MPYSRAAKLIMGLESTTNQILWMGESLLGYGRVLCPLEIEKRFFISSILEPLS